MRKERFWWWGGGCEGRKSQFYWKEERAKGLFVCAPHPLNTQSGLYCILQIYTQDVGLECFPEKKRERERVFFLPPSSKCLLSWARVIEAHKQTFVSKLTDASCDLHPTQRHICTFFFFFNTLRLCDGQAAPAFLIKINSNDNINIEKDGECYFCSSLSKNKKKRSLCSWIRDPLSTMSECFSNAPLSVLKYVCTGSCLQCAGQRRWWQANL